MPNSYDGSGRVNRIITFRFISGRRAITVAGVARKVEPMPKTIAQWTGIIVTTIVVLGCDMDVLYAVPLGIFAGALATFFVELDDRRRLVRAG